MIDPCKTCNSTERYKDGRCAVCTRDSNKRWKEKNKEKHRLGSLSWSTANPEKRRKIALKWSRKNPEKIREIKRTWRKNNPDKHVAEQHRRRTKKITNGGNYAVAEWKSLCKKYNYRCLSCNKEDVLLTVDHIIALDKGGTNEISNIQPLCAKCNSVKGTKTIDYRTA